MSTASGGVGLPPLDGSSRPLPQSTAEAQPPLTGIYTYWHVQCICIHLVYVHYMHILLCLSVNTVFGWEVHIMTCHIFVAGMKRPRSRSWEPHSQLTPSSKRGNTTLRPSTKHQRSQTAGSAFSRPRKQREQFRSALVKLILYVSPVLHYTVPSTLASIDWCLPLQPWKGSG